jgi:dihydropteroate synthase
MALNSVVFVPEMATLEYLAELKEKYATCLQARVKEFSIRGRHFDFNSRPAIMGVINMSADSWYRESVVLNRESAMRRAHTLKAQGADVIDIGAESTLAHAARAKAQTQKEKLLPVIEELCRNDLLISVETYQPAVTRACLKAGAGILNLTAAKGTKDFFRMVSQHDAAVIICYVQGANVREVKNFDFGSDPIGMMYEYFSRQIEIATGAGLERLFLDPGLGFYYRNLQDSSIRVRHQMSVFLNTFRLRTLGFPICHALPHAFEFFGEEVRSAEPFFAMLAKLGKTDLFRTHEVARVKAVLDTMQVF